MQAARKGHASSREKDGKKPFYIIVDREGIPYGSGKPAWMQEINKLAIDLDPSCTHIRKQTYEDVTVFKERLSQSFEYSGQLNEEHLRTLMERAVTSKRRQLMALIKEGGAQPNHIDSEVWECLLKLKASKQWEEKSLQGKKANSSRKTINRTGNRVVNGVSEILRETLERSPDPDKVYAEAHHNKGSKPRKVKKEKPQPISDESVGDESLEEDDREKLVENSSEQRDSDDGVVRLSHLRSAPEVVNFHGCLITSLKFRVTHVVYWIVY